MSSRLIDKSNKREVGAGILLKVVVTEEFLLLLPLDPCLGVNLLCLSF